MRDPRLGDKESFVPSAWTNAKDSNDAIKYSKTLTGTVIHVNRPHRHYTLAAECNGYTVRESFKF